MGDESAGDNAVVGANGDEDEHVTMCVTSLVSADCEDTATEDKEALFEALARLVFGSGGQFPLPLGFRFLVFAEIGNRTGREGPGCNHKLDFDSFVMQMIK